MGFDCPIYPVCCLRKNKKHQTENCMMKFIASMILIRLKKHLLLVISLSALIVGGIAAFPWPYLSASNTILGFCLLPFVLFTCGRPRFNFIYLLAAVIFGGIGYIYHVRAFYFLSLAFYMIFVFDLTLGKINSLLLFLTVVMSPVFTQISVIIGFPVRLYLSQWSGNILEWAGLNIKVEGNTMLVDSYDFTVDEACMGLSMLSISVLMGIFILAHQYKATKLRLPIKYLSLFFLVLLALNIVCNLLRILVIVVFRILPTDPWHEIIGILCLIFYVVIPLYFLSITMIKKLGQPPLDNSTIKFSFTLPFKALTVALSIILMVIGFTINPGKTNNTIHYADVKLVGMRPIELEGGITKLLNEDILIYVKPIPEFFTSEHTPLLCWKGSGYTFKNIDQILIGNRQIYSGVLSKNNDLLYTAWWYTNGELQTIDQLTWRSKMLVDQKRFCLVNVTARDEVTLHRYLISMFNSNKLIISKL
ncbi:MAG: exosortase N [Marivirga sp.]|nr:exosortase N [Marivirga sp.]